MYNHEESYFDQIIGPRQRALPPRDTNGLSFNDKWWIQHFEYLKGLGYMMRPRYRPGWKPSYDPKKVLEKTYAEDGQFMIHPDVMDALRISDSLVVALKRVKVFTGEARIATLFSDDTHNLDKRNHCVRILEVLPVPDEDDEKFLVMLWMRPVMDPRFRTVGEGIQFFKEMIEGLQYMHENNVAHRDCSLNNMAMDANTMYTRPFHPIEPKKRYDWSGRALHHSRTRRPPKYYLIDFGHSRMYDPSQTRPLKYALRSGGYTPPEGDKGIPCDPFATDVFLLGNLMRTSFLDGDPDMHEPGVSGFEFLRSLVTDMVAEEPSKRPTMDEVAARFTQIVDRLSWWTLRSRAIKNSEISLFKPFRAVYHIFWTASMLQSYFDQIIAPRPRAWPPRDENELRPEDHWWINHFEYLKEHGYMMRPRYRPGWKPSYDTKAVWERSRAEDGQELIRVKATEARIATLFSDDAHRDDPRNHCVRILEVLPVPEADDMKILVMTWMRPIINPRFRTIGEGIQFFREMIEGLQYMHENNVAHRDCSINNMAMDANSMYTRPFHPIKPKKRYDWSGRALHHSRTCRPPRYFLIDFGQSRMYDPFQPGRPLEYALSSSGGYASPEGVEGYPSDPFATDVYLLGNLIRITFLDVSTFMNVPSTRCLIKSTSGRS
ncbi:kinase-like domain-containing protein [Lentinula raphanica]|nr:kinase-like domain-containing protein [Lentinula raphanica]